jgi:hypothetical protein
MSGQKIELAKEAARATAELLGPDDSLSVIGFSGQPERHVRMQSAGNRLRITNDIARLSAQGGTAIFPALDTALTDLLPVRARVKHVILLTDGQTQESGIPELVQAMRAEGITVSAIGLGADVHRSLLQQIAVLGGGRAYFTNDPESVPRIFVRETTSLSQSSVVEDLTKAVVVEPADFLKGLDLARAPLLRGYVATESRPRPAQTILASELGEPLLARMRVGLGWSLAFTSDLKPRWAADFLRWNDLPRFWGQLVREHMKSEREEELPMRVELIGNRVRVTVDALTPDEAFRNDLESSVTLRGPLGDAAGAEASTQHPLPLRAPGRYQTEIEIARPGTYTLEAEHRTAGRAVAKSHASVALPYPREYAAHEANLELLRKLAAITGGDEARAAQAAFEARGETLLRAQPLWPHLLVAALVAFLLDLALRRTRLSARGRARL